MIYISGAITNVPDYQKKFEAAKDYLVNVLKFNAAEVVNPCDTKLPDGSSWLDFMRADIKKLCDCDSVYMLSNWRRSKGARCERKLAKMLGLIIIYEGGI